MKKFLFLLYMLYFWLQAHNQNIGLGTAAPAAPLHIKSLTAVELLRLEGDRPYISFFDGPTYKGYLWYDGTRMILGSSTAESVVISANYSSAPAYFTSNGRLGLGVSAPTEKLDVNGSINLNGLIKINGSSGTTGQVLTSNGASDPQWRSAAYSNTTRFSFGMSASSAHSNIGFVGTRYNLNTADVVANPTSITINRTGLYHFDIIFSALVDYDDFVSVTPSIYIDFRIGTHTYFVVQGKPLSQEPGTVDYRLTERFSIDLHITGPTTITIPYDFYSIIVPGLASLGGQFTGYLISE